MLVTYENHEVYIFISKVDAVRKFLDRDESRIQIIHIELKRAEKEAAFSTLLTVLHGTTHVGKTMVTRSSVQCGYSLYIDLRD